MYKNQPPVAGAITWEKSLFHRIKHIMLQFLPVKELMANNQGREAREKYLFVGRQMRSFSDRLHREWFTKVEEFLPDILRKPLLENTELRNKKISFQTQLKKPSEVLSQKG